MNARHNMRRLLVCGGSVAALAISFPALAQTAPAPADPPKTQDDVPPAPSPAGDIVITGSRAITNGANAPTPVTVVSSQQLVAGQPGNVADALTTLPVFTGSYKPSSAGSNHSATGAGANLLALRGLGPTRTLVLLDGRRIVNTTINGTTDVNLVPQGLISRVDIVTGGASAAYGSDAVAGVVNFVLDSKFKGVKVNVQGGLSSRGDAGSMKGNLTFGTDFGTDSLHLILSGDYYRMKGIDWDYGGRQWADDGWMVIPESATSSRLVLVKDTRDALGSFGGTITACQNALGVATACPTLSRMQFNPDGTLKPFVQGTNVSAATMSGGDGTARRTDLIPTVESKNFFGRFTVDLAPKISAYVEGNYGKVYTDYLAAYDTNQLASAAFTIFADNAYLPAAVKTQMATAGVNSFTLYRVNADFQPNRYFTNTTTKRIVGGIDGALGGSWKFSAYAQYGEADTLYRINHNQIMDNVYNAADAVIDPVSGLAVCRSVLLGTRPGPCTPINLFGQGAPSGAAVAYVTGTSMVRVKTSQLVAAGSVRGELFSIASDPVTVAFGGEYRREKGAVTEDAITAGTRNGAGIRGYPTAQQGLFGGYLYSIDGLPLAGRYDVKEGFLEVNVPIVKDATFFNRLDLNGAIRYADYSTVGGKTTWKIGGLWEPIPDIRFRATRSRDIRAPNIAELYTVSNQINGATASDPQLGGTRTIFIQRQTGNRSLDAEEADTTNLGVVFKPRFLPGLTASVDYFNIDIKNVISQATVQQVVDQCGLSACPLVVRDPISNVINVVITPFQNLARLKTRGEDYELSYVTKFAGGTLNLRALATHTRKLALVVNGVELDRVGDLNVLQNTNPPAAVSWTGSGSVDWRSDRFHFFVQERYIGSGRLDHTVVYAPGVDTSVKAIWYTDLTLGYTLPTATNSFEVYGTINNLFDQSPPITPNGAPTTPRSANGGIYDFLGRYITVGVRMKF